MPRIKLRYRESTPLYEAAPGQVDEVRGKLDAVAAAIDGMNDDEFSSSLRTPCQSAASSLERVRAFTWSVADDVQAKQSALSGFARTHSMQRAKTETPTSGFRDVQQREEIIASTAEKISADVMEQAAADVVSGDAIQQRGAQLAQASVDALTTLDKTITACKQDWFGPRTLSAVADTSVERIMRINRLGLELRATPPQQVLSLFRGLVERGETEKAKDIIDAFAVELPSLKTTDAGKLLAMYGRRAMRADLAEEFRTAFDQISEAFEQFNEQTMPNSIAVSDVVLDECRALFWQLLGVAPGFLLTPDYGLRDEKRDPLTVADDWISRRLPNVRGRSLPSGWSPVVGKTADGVRFRKAAG